MWVIAFGGRTYGWWGEEGDYNSSASRTGGHSHGDGYYMSKTSTHSVEVWAQTQRMLRYILSLC